MAAEPPDPPISVESELTAADLAHADGRWQQAERHLRQLLRQVVAADYEWDEWLRRLAEVYRFAGRPRDAGTLYLYLHYHDLARELLPRDAHAERAQCLALEKRWAEAAREWTAASMPVHAAVAHEEAKDLPRARVAWSTLAEDPRLADRPYERALVAFNLGVAIARDGGDGERAEVTRWFVAAQRLLEQAADDHETAGERDRAFDCYQILIKLGQESGAFENLAEGYLNSIRVLAADGLKFYVLQFYDEFLEQALERQELHAAATLCREAAEYATRTGLPNGRYYLERAGEVWWREADRGTKAKAPVELVENALTAAADCYSLAGDFAKVRDTWQRLARLDLGDKKRTRYLALAARWAAAPAHDGDDSDEGALAPPPRPPRPPSNLWFIDLLDWENGGDPERMALAIVGDLHFPDHVRRRAVNLLLQIRGGGALPDIADSLGQLRTYEALLPLERMYTEGNIRVRRAAVSALRHLSFKRSFALLGRGLADPEPEVKKAALEALRNLHFAHALQPLTRLFREHPDEKVRIAALESLGKIGTIEVGELLISVLRQETDPLRTVARLALSHYGDGDIVPILRQQLDLETSPELRRIFEDLLGKLKRK